MSERFVVSARKFRPDSFESLLGQEAVSETLRRSILQGKTAHAYLFCGPRGVGKTSAARIFAKAINCTDITSEGEACGKCESCRAFEEQRSINIFEMDAASNNSTNDIRRLIEEVSIPPQVGRYKVYIVDEVHMLSTAAFNAFLKTLEEPPEYVVFIMATTEKHKVLPTILSRCQVYDFRPIPNDIIVQQLKHIAAIEEITVEDKALELIARKADGGMRDALSVFDRIASFTGGEVSYQRTLSSLNILDDEYYYRLVILIKQNDYTSVLLLFDELLQKGFDARTIVEGLADFMRNLLLAFDALTLPLLRLSNETATAYNQLALSCGKGFLYQSINKLLACLKEYRQSNAKRLLVEMTLMSLTSLSQEGIVQGGNQPIPSTTTPAPQATPVKPQVAPQPRPIPAPPFPTTSNHNVAAPKPIEAPKTAQLPNGGTRMAPRPTPAPRPMARATAASVSTATQAREVREEQPFTEEDMQVAWNKFAAEHLQGKDNFLYNTFEALLPTLSANNVCEVATLNMPQESAIGRIKNQLQAYLRKELHNSSITLEVHQVENLQEAEIMVGKPPMEVLREQLNDPTTPVHQLFKELKVRPI